jgi:hypothetical protein
MSININSLGLVVGVLLILLGRKLFWLFVGVIGFLWGLQITPLWLRGESQVVILTVALAVGLIGAVMAIFLQHLAVGVAGFLAGAHLFNALWALMNWHSIHYLWMLSVVGGVIGAVLAILLLNWALIILSSLIGASLICQALPFQQAKSVLCFIVLVSIGVLVQSNLTRRPALAS